MENQQNQQVPSQPAPVAPVAQPWPEQTPTPAKIQYVVAQKSLNGIGGLLVFWMIIFSLSGLGYITTFFTQIANGFSTGSEVALVIFAPLIAISSIASVVLIALRKKLGKLASMATIGVITLYSIVNAIIAASSDASSTNMGAVIGGIIASLVFGGLVVLYFIASKRVKQTLVG